MCINVLLNVLNRLLQLNQSVYIIIKFCYRGLRFGLVLVIILSTCWTQSHLV